MREKIKAVSIFVVLALLLNIVIPTMKVMAAEYGNGNYKISVFAGIDDEEDTNVTVNSVIVNGENCTSKTDYYKNASGAYSIVIKVTADEGYTASLRSREGLEIPDPNVSGQVYTYIINLESSDIDWDDEEEIHKANLEFYASSNEIVDEDEENDENIEDSEDAEEPEDSEDIEGGETREDMPRPQDYENIYINFTFTGTTGVVVINDKGVGEETDSWSGTVENAGYTDSSKTNEIHVVNSFGAPKFSKITINGVDYSFTDNADEHIIEVAGADSYTIKAEADLSIAQDRTIIWANVGANENAKQYEEDMVLEHGSASIVAVYDENGKKVDNDSKVDKDGFGFATIKPDSKVVFQFVPEYGYQLTSVKANGFPLEPQKATNQYTFIMPDTNVHFSAEFTKTKDIVKAESKKVSNGTINLGSALEGGSAELSVKDVELSSDKIVGFEEAAGDYKISQYLDIDLYNVFYKGKDDSEDVWSNKIDELDEEATISLKLEDGLTAEDIVIVHNLHDGDKYEIIKIDSYDPEANTITFKTKTFSNYAIATKENTAKIIEKEVNEVKEEKEVKKETLSNPQTGDNIIIVISLFAIATLGVFITIKYNKNTKTGK